MNKILVLVLIATFMLTGCAGVEVYTFKKDRVDQSETGNQGYLMGDAPQAQAKEAPSKRTLIGVDIEIAQSPSKSSGTQASFDTPPAKTSGCAVEPKAKESVYIK